MNEIITIILIYMIPMGITLYHSIQTKSEILAVYAVTPLVNIIGMFIAIGEMLFKSLS